MGASNFREGWGLENVGLVVTCGCLAWDLWYDRIECYLLFDRRPPVIECVKGRPGTSTWTPIFFRGKTAARWRQFAGRLVHACLWLQGSVG